MSSFYQKRQQLKVSGSVVGVGVSVVVGDNHDYVYKLNYYNVSKF